MSGKRNLPFIIGVILGILMMAAAAGAVTGHNPVRLVSASLLSEEDPVTGEEPAECPVDPGQEPPSEDGTTPEDPFGEATALEEEPSEPPSEDGTTPEDPSEDEPADCPDDGTEDPADGTEDPVDGTEDSPDEGSPEDQAEGEDEDGQGPERFTEGCVLPDGSPFEGNHGQYVSAWAHSDPSTARDAAHSPCGKPVQAVHQDTEGDDEGDEGVEAQSGDQESHGRSGEAHGRSGEAPGHGGPHPGRGPKHGHP
jgi:hypothetical protein